MDTVTRPICVMPGTAQDGPACGARGLCVFSQQLAGLVSSSDEVHLMAQLAQSVSPITADAPDYLSQDGRYPLT
jgi:hypothetical protein